MWSSSATQKPTLPPFWAVRAEAAVLRSRGKTQGEVLSLPPSPPTPSSRPLCPSTSSLSHLLNKYALPLGLTQCPPWALGAARRGVVSDTSGLHSVWESRPETRCSVTQLLSGSYGSASRSGISPVWWWWVRILIWVRSRGFWVRLTIAGIPRALLWASPVLSTLLVLSELILPPICTDAYLAVLTLLLQMRLLRFERVKQLAQEYRVARWRHHGWHPRSAWIPSLCLLLPGALPAS